MEEQYRYCFETLFADDLGHFPRLLFIQRRAHRTVGEHALGDLEDILPRHQRPVLPETRVERFRAIDPADLIDVAEPFGGDQRGLGALALDHRVNHDGRAMNQRQHLIKRHRGLV